MIQTHALAIQVKFGLAIDCAYLLERCLENALKIVHTSVSMTELLLLGDPRDEGGFVGVHAMEPLGQLVWVERQGTPKTSLSGRNADGSTSEPPIETEHQRHSD